MSLQYLMGAEIDFEDGSKARASSSATPMPRQHLRLRQFVLDVREAAMTITVTPEGRGTHMSRRA
jgi:hypothetical protein